MTIIPYDRAATKTTADHAHRWARRVVLGIVSQSGGQIAVRPKFCEEPSLSPEAAASANRSTRTGHAVEVAWSNPYPLIADRVRHEVPGMRGIYSHISDTMRAHLIKVLQTSWEQALAARARLAPRSTVPLMARLLQHTPA